MVNCETAFGARAVVVSLLPNAFAGGRGGGVRLAAVNPFADGSGAARVVVRQQGVDKQVRHCVHRSKMGGVQRGRVHDSGVAPAAGGRPDAAAVVRKADRGKLPRQRSGGEDKQHNSADNGGGVHDDGRGI